MSTDVLNKKEKLLIEHMIADRVTLSRCIRILKPSYFDKPLDRVVGFVIEYFNKYHSCPSVDAIEAETDIQLKARQIEDHEVQYLLEEIEELCQDAAMVEAVLKAADMIEGDAKKAIPNIMREALMVSLDNSIGTSIFDDPESRITMMADAIDERPMGIPKLDKLIGNIRRAELGIVYAVSSGGKSVALGNIAYLLAKQDLDVAIISMELNEELYSKRLDTVLTGFDIAHHADHATDIASALGSLQSSMGDITTKKMRARSTPEDIRLYLTEYHLAKGKYPDVILVDYLALMASSNPNLRGAGVHAEQEDIAIELRDLAVEFNMYAWTAGQLNRDAQSIIDVNPSHVAGGISVINTVDTAIAITASEEDIENNQIQVGQLKIRNAQKTPEHITIYRCPKTLRMSDTPFTGKNIVSPIKPTSSQKKTSKPSPKDLTSSTGKAKLKKALKFANQ